MVIPRVGGRGGGPCVVVRGDAGRRPGTHRCAARERPRLHDVAGRRSGQRRHGRRHQPDATRCGAGARHHVHRVPGDRDRDEPGALARRSRPRSLERPGAGGRRSVVRHGPRSSPGCRSPRRGRRAERHVPLAVHVGNQRCTQGGHHVARSARPRGHVDAHAHPTAAERRRLHLDAAVPLQRAVHGLGAQPGHRQHGCVAAHVLGVGLPARRASVRRHLLQLRRQAAGLHPRHPRATRRRRQHAALRLRQRGQRGRHRQLRPPLRLHPR